MKTYSLVLKQKLHEFSKPVVMGILNITPDSFLEGSRMLSEAQSVDVAGTMLENGAFFLDLGGQSTRPGATLVGNQEELDRILPHLEAVLKAFPAAIISVDTFYSSVASAALQAGAALVNDVTAGAADQLMFETAAKHGAPYICMHMQGTPQTMQQHPQYQDIMAETTLFFSQKIKQMHEAGIHDIILDPGFGFGKNQDHNWTMMKHLNEYSLLNKPLLVGISRKKMIQRATGTTQEKALNGTTAAHMLALKQGAAILRVHDVKEAAQAIQIFQAYTEAV